MDTFDRVYGYGYWDFVCSVFLFCAIADSDCHSGSLISGIVDHGYGAL